MRIPGLRRKDAGARYVPPPAYTVCPVCVYRNEPSARFCRNCGLPLGTPRDPVRGTMTRKADLPSSHGTGIAALVGLAMVVVILAGSAFLVFRGFSASGTDASSPTTTPTGAIAANPTPRPTQAEPVDPTTDPVAS